VAFCLGVILVGVSYADTSQKEAKAVKAAESWLKIMDNGNYGEGWEKAATYLKGAISKKDFESQLTAVRKPLGKLLSRTVKSKTYATTLPGAPDGEYVVIQFSTSFEKKKEAIETVTPMLEKDGTWKVSGYYIK